MSNFFIISIIGVSLLTPFISRFLAEKSNKMVFYILIYVPLIYYLFFEVIPSLITAPESNGVALFVTVVLSFLITMLLETTLLKTKRSQIHMGLKFFSLAAIMLHMINDGIAVKLNDHFAWMVLLHKAPVLAFIWDIALEKLSFKLGYLATQAFTALVLVGVFLPPSFHDFIINNQVSYFIQALSVGSILHICFEPLEMFWSYFKEMFFKKKHVDLINYTHD